MIGDYVGFIPECTNDPDWKPYLTHCTALKLL